jgi:hypothetical protein
VAVRALRDVSTTHPTLPCCALQGRESSVVELFFVISLAAYVHMIYFLATELATILGIHIFKVKQR